ncbi:MAG: hypothetical protein PHS68_06090 [Candidatus Izemoplasmatales bacterium]|nr:hypothetical protein [Candidatus Izemoplasmatales bacterium]
MDETTDDAVVIDTEVDEATDDDAVVIDTEVDEATDSNETAQDEDAEAIKASLAKALKAKAELTARAKRAEEE